MSKKMSYASVIADVLNGVALTDEHIERLNALKASLEKRGSRKAVGPTKAQKARAELAERVFNALEAGKSYTTADITGLVPELEGATPQKITPLMKLIGERIVTEKVKGKTIYSLA